MRPFAVLVAATVILTGCVATTPEIEKEETTAPSAGNKNQLPLVCRPTEMIIEYLGSGFYEQIDGVGESNPSSGSFLAEIWLGPDGQTWTWVVSNGAISCIVLAGTKWQSIGRIESRGERI
jgi:hypothetical protein